MKKLLTFAVAAVAASAIQAASINWGGDTLNSANTTPGWEGYANAGTTYALILVGDTVGTPTTYDPSTKLTDAGGTVVDTYVLTDDDANNAQWGPKAYGAPADDINGKWFMVTVYDPSTGSADFTTFQVSGASDTGSAFDAAAQMGGLGNNMGSVSVSQNVPEPTTVALLALGLAAVGLKRKVA